jgi:hypothetical protein
MDRKRILKLASNLDNGGHIGVSNDLVDLCDFQKIAKQSSSRSDFGNRLAGKVLDVRSKYEGQELSQELGNVTAKIYDNGIEKSAGWKDMWDKGKSWAAASTSAR